MTREQTTTVTETPPPQAGPREQLETERVEHKLAVKEQLSEVDVQLDHLDRQRAERGQIAGPISMLATGYTTGLAALAVSITGVVGAQRVKNGHHDDKYDVNNDQVVNGQDEDRFRNVARGMGALAGVGFAVGIVGSVFLKKRLNERREYDPEVRRLQNRKQELKRELDYSVNTTGTGVGFGVRGKF